MSRDDFKSDESWEKFMLYRRIMKNKMSIVHARNSRQKKKLHNFTDVINHLKEENETATAEFLQVFI